MRRILGSAVVLSLLVTLLTASVAHASTRVDPWGEWAHEHTNLPDVQALLQEPRQRLLEAVDAAKAHLDEGKLDTDRLTELEEAVAEAAEAALALTPTPAHDPLALATPGPVPTRTLVLAELREARAAIQDAHADLRERVEAWDEEVAAEKERRRKAEEERRRRAAAAAAAFGGSYTGGGGGDWFAQYRALLNDAGGAHVPLYVCPGNCYGSTAYSTPQGIFIHHRAASWPYARKVFLVTHELAHAYQWKVWNALQNSSRYAALFGMDQELLANCMASVRGVTNHGHHGLCNADRRAFAAQIWRGVVPG